MNSIPQRDTSAISATGRPQISGGSFLIEERQPEEIFTPEDFTEQRCQIAAQVVAQDKFVF